MSKHSVFISYSHHDDRWRSLLTDQLGVLQHEGLLDFWSDEQIGAGDDWESEIESAIERASVAVLLVSAKFLTSDFILGNEVPALLARRRQRGLVVFPIIVEPCRYQDVEWLGGLQARPRNRDSLLAGNEYEQKKDLSRIAKEITDLDTRAARGETGADREDEITQNSEDDHAAAGSGGGEDEEDLRRDDLLKGLRRNEYADLAVELRHSDLGQYRVELRLSQSGVEGDNRHCQKVVRLDLSELDERVDDAVRYGGYLAEHIFADADMVEAYGTARRIARELSVPLRIRICIPPHAKELHRVRWETLRDPTGRGDFVVSDPTVIFSRYVSGYDENWRDVRLRPVAKLRSLVVVAHPKALATLPGHPGATPEEAIAKVEGAKELLGDSVVDSVHREEDTTLPEIIRRLRELEIDILYLACTWTDEDGSPRALLPSTDGGIDLIPPEQLAAELRRLAVPPRLVILGPSPEESDEPPPDLWRVAPTISEAGVAGVLAAQRRMSVGTWRAFVRRLLAELQHHGHMDLAAELARRAVISQPDCWEPALFLRLRSARIWYTPGFLDRRQGERTWNALIESIRPPEQRCTPVIGDGVNDDIVRARRDIAQRMADSHHFPMDVHDRLSLPQVAQYLSVEEEDVSAVQREFRGALRTFLWEEFGPQLAGTSRDSDVHSLISAIGKGRRDAGVRTPFGALARLPLPIYITTNQTSLLSDSLRAVGKVPQTAIFPALDRADYGPPVDHGTQPRPTEERPLVYHLFGLLEEPDTLVLTEDDHFEFLSAFASKRDLMPMAVRGALTSAGLLFLGFKVHHWDFRVLFRSMTAMQGSALRERRSHVAVQIDPDDDQIIDPERARRYLDRRLSTSQINVFWGAAEEFLGQLLERWEEDARHARG